jgi:hypothetical protein
MVFLAGLTAGLRRGLAVSGLASALTAPKTGRTDAVGVPTIMDVHGMMATTKAHDVPR